MPQTTLPAGVKGHRFLELDSIRGLAATAVMIGHLVGLWSIPLLNGMGRWFPFNLLVNGGASVMLFFTLSGFVLTLPFRRVPLSTYPSFLVKRACRLYLPYAAAMLVVLAVRVSVPEPVYYNFSYGFDVVWNPPLTARHLMQHFLVLADPNVYEMGGPFWTLIIEMRLSLLMPLIAWCALRLRLLPGVLISILGSLVCALLQKHVHHQLVTGTLAYIFTFFNGALLAAHLDAIGAFWSRTPSWLKVVIGGAALVSYSYYPFNLGFGQGALHEMSQRQICSFASIILILCAIYFAPIRHQLHRAPLLHLGTISYSLYLLHFIVIVAAIHLFRGNAVPLVMLIPILLTIWIITEVFYRAVELPSIALGRWVGKRLAGKQTGAETLAR